MVWDTDWGRKHLSELLYLQNEGDLELAGVCDSDPAAITDLPFPIYRCQKVEDIVDRADAFVVATPNETHSSIAWDLIAKDKAVLLEKPLTHSIGGLELLEGLLQQKGGILLPGHLYRFSDLIREAKQRLLRMNPIGVKFRWTDFFPNTRSADIIMDLMPHILDICKDMFGEMPLIHQVIWDGFRERKETCILVGMMEKKDVVFSCELSYGLPQKHRSIEVISQSGSMNLDLVMRPDFIRLTSELKTEEIWVPPNNTLRDELRFFAKAVETGNPHIQLLWDAAEGMRMLFKLQSLEEVRK